MFIQSGGLVIILKHNVTPSMDNPNRIERIKSFLHSIRFRTLTIMLIVGTVPMMMASYFIMSLYENSEIEHRTVLIQSQINTIAERIGKSNQYLGKNAEIYENELDFASDVFDGRIMVINNKLQIIKDTYVFEEGKILLSEGIMEVISGKKNNNIIKNDGYIEIISPIHSSEGKIIGAINIMLTTSDILSAITTANSKAYAYRIILFTVIFIIAFLFSRAYVKPVKAMTDSLMRYASGYEDERVRENVYTETKLLSESFNKMLDKMQKLDSSRQEFVSNVSHELKTPITSIKVLADSLNGQEDVPVELYKEFMTDIVAEIDRENKIINDLLELVRLDRTNAVLNITTVNINELLELTLKRIKPIAIKKNIEVTYESFRSVSAEIDEVKLTLAISNLVENAIKYNIDNGWVKVSLNSDHQYFYLKVEDSGIGIPAEAQDMVFERFYRVDKARSRETGGTGLGLAIVKNIILMHKGSIKLYSKEDEGTTFTIRIPLSYVS